MIKRCFTKKHPKKTSQRGQHYGEGSSTTITCLGRVLPRFEEPGFQFGHWPRASDGGVSWFFNYSDTALEFMRMTYDEEWVRRDIKWAEWKESPEAIELRDNPQALAKATPEQLTKLLTTLIRQERFCEGQLSAAFECSLLTRICKRAASLAEELEKNSP